MCSIRPFVETDISFALAQTTREGWDDTVETFRVCLAHDPRGCFVAEADGEPVGIITTTCYRRAAWIGNLIVVPRYRRRGLGERLMTHVIETLSAGGIRTFRLEADPPGVGIYRRLGFEAEFETPQMVKHPPHEPPPGTAPSLGAADLEAVKTFDRRYFGDDRGRFLDLVLGTAHGAWCARPEGRITGFAVTGPSSKGVRLGPLAAITDDAAVSLTNAALASAPRSVFVVSVPGVNRAAIERLESAGFVVASTTLRMRLGPREFESHPSHLIALTNGASG